ncbi:proton channel OTOP1 [Scleropages formosus]|uniref:proton channel OTOP1 n=1 Tax=Scleropages formosus TaxID=113540 RepID=UPI0010FAB4A6|nr:proton channel OTOP1 [Scleropages formosus]
MKDLDIIEFGAIVERGELDVTRVVEKKPRAELPAAQPADSDRDGDREKVEREDREEEDEQDEDHEEEEGGDDGNENMRKKTRKKRKMMKVSLTKDYPKKNAEMLSGQYGTNLLLVGVALMLAAAHDDALVREEHLLSFITALMLLQLFWMLWYVVRRGRMRHARPQRDKDAGTSWIRGGLTLLALLSLIMDAFRIGFYVGDESCLSIALAVYPVIHAVHTISQVHFLWFYIKDVIKTFETFERFGVIHAVFTNLLLWCNGIMTEAHHFMNNQRRRLTELGYLNVTTSSHEPHCNCTSSICTIFLNSLYYLYPFNIEYHILVSAMLFVMWKNIGRTINYHGSRKAASNWLTSAIVGPILGLIAVAATIAVLVVYIILVEDSRDTHESAIYIFYCYGIVMLAFMCVAGGAGLLLYRVDRRPFDSTKHPSRRLDTELLFSSSVGAWLMSWCSVVAVAAAHSSPSYRWTNILYSLLLVLEKYVQNIFIIESLYREPDPADGVEAPPPATPEVFSVAIDAPPYSGIVNRAYENQESGCPSPEGGQEENGQGFSCAKRQAEASQPPAQAPPPAKASPHARSLKWRRQVLKNISIFLLLCNMSLWILPAFGCRPQYDNELEQETFGFTTWNTVLNFAMPLNLFYRMHSSALLFEVFRRV